MSRAKLDAKNAQWAKEMKILGSKILKNAKFQKIHSEPPKIDLFRTKTISHTYLGINVEVYDPKVQIWRGGKKDKLT